MGSGASAQSTAVVAVPKDVRVDRNVKRLDIPEKLLEKVWLDFSKYMQGKKISTEDFFEKFGETKKNILTEGLLDLVETESPSYVSFGEFIDIVCIWCTFDIDDIVKYCYYIIDREKTGTCNKLEVKYFVRQIYNYESNSNIELGLEYLDRFDGGDGLITYQEFFEMVRLFPQTFAPAFKLQTNFARSSFGLDWWENTRRDYADKVAQKKKDEMDRLKKLIKDQSGENNAQLEALVMKRMGIFYYIAPWQRKKNRAQVSKIQKINENLEKDEKSTKKQPANDAKEP